MRKRLAEITKGGTRPRVTLNEFYKLKLPAPSKKTQERIEKLYLSKLEILKLLKAKVDHVEKIKSAIIFSEGSDV